MPPKKSKYSKSGGSKPAPTPEYTLDMIVDPTEDAPLDMDMIKKVTQTPDPTASNNIRVAVRIRPPNQRELDGGASNVIVHKEGLKVVVGEPPNAADFTYDVVLANATQPEAFEAIGVNIVHSAYHGFNSTCFAYGQTSSGKSYSMIGKLGGSTGIGEHTGITPRVATLLFDVAKAADATHEFFIEASFLEIYNEKVRDLLEPSTDPDTLKIRESPQHGVHVVGLTKRHVKSATEVVRTLITGFMNRTVSATAYNAESSRSHAVFELTVQQKYVEPASGEKMAKASKINLVDLAGSERSDKVGTKGAALVEGNNINLSLSVLGRCIKALVEVANEAAKNPPPPPPPKDGKKKKKKKGDEAEKPQGKVVPFRESVLTWYLRESLAGNARTTMLAACSPVALNKEETLSTLRYAASAKNIKTLASKNEDPMEAKVRELAEEIQRLKAALEAQEGGDGGGGGGGEDAQSSKWALAASRRGSIVVGLGAEETMSEEEKETYLEELESTMSRLLPGGFIRNSRQSMSGDNVLGQGSGPAQCYPLLSCLNKDEMLSHAMTVPCLPRTAGEPFTVGRDGGGRDNDFPLNGVGIHPRHCQIDEVEAGPEGGGRKKFMISSAGSGAVVLINGQSLEELGQPAVLTHLDRITLGPCRLLALFLTEPLTSEQKAHWTYEAAFSELMHRESLQWTLLGPKRRRLLDKLKEAEILFVEQANAIAIDMCTCVRFHATIILGDGAPLLRKAEASVDDVLEAGDCEVVIVCSVDPSHIVETREDQLASVAIVEAQKEAEAKEEAERAAASDESGAGERQRPGCKMTREASMMLDHQLSIDPDDELELSPKGPAAHKFPSKKDFEDMKNQKALGESGGDGGEDGEDGDEPGSPGNLLTLKEELQRMNSLTLFEMKMDQFEELLAELKVTYSYVASLSQGMSDGDGGSGDEGNTVQAIFDTVDCDGSGLIDRAELAAAFKLFDETAIDPDFCEHMMDDLLPDTMSGLDFDSFSSFLVKFLQHQYFHKLEPFVSNQRLFVCLGGRDLADTINEERKKEQALELRNAELEHEVGALRKALKNGGVLGDDDSGETEALLEEEGLDAEGEEGVLKFMKHAGLDQFGSVLVGMGVDNISDLLDSDLVGEEELGEAGLGEAEIALFKDAVSKRKAKKEALEKEAQSKFGLEGSVHENFDPTIIGLDALTEVPVIIMNARSKRKLFAQSGKRPTIFETWNKGFGAGPEEHTFKDNKWWLVPQKDTSSYVIVNAHSSRKLYAKVLRPGAVWEKEVGAVAADDTSLENFWNLIPESDGTYTLQNASSLRKMYARTSKLGDQWTAGVGAAPNDATSTDTKWYLIPDPASMDSVTGKALLQKPVDMSNDAAKNNAPPASPKGGLVRMMSGLSTKE